MRILIISDIHSNLPALEAALAAAGEFDATWCLGDLVGYGPDPNECIIRVRQLPNLICLIGNHDAAAIGRIDLDSFNPDARQAVLWTQQALTQASKDYLHSLPEKTMNGEVTLAHGSPRHPVWEYVLDTRTATQNFSHFETPFCFVGHSHLPVIYLKPDEHLSASLFVPEPQADIRMNPRAIFNPGSIGQPRDRDPRASYAIFESTEQLWKYRRAAYDITSVQARMVEAGLPDRHIRRLTAGW